MKPPYKGASVWIENNDGTISSFHDRSKTLTLAEYLKFQVLQSQSGYGTITIVKPKPHEITNPSYIPYESKP